MVHVDFNDPQRKRTLKLSAKYIQEVANTRTVPDTERYAKKLQNGCR